MLGAPSDCTPLDMLGSLALNIGSTHVACRNDSLRFGIKVKGEVPAYTDLRFILGIAAAGVAQFGGDMVRRAGHDAALGLLHSFVATETARHAAIKRLQERSAAPPPAIQASAPVGERVPAGATNQGAYGW